MNRSLTNKAHAHTVRADALIAQMHATDRAAIAEAIERQDVAELERAGIARRIKQARKEAGLSQPEMADALGVISRTYQNYESLKDPRTPWGSMNDIAKITGKSTEWLIHGDKATPDLLGSVGKVDSHIDEMAEEFRGHVKEMLGLLREARSERHRIEELLATQQGILERMEAAAAGFPDDENVRMLNEAAQQLWDIASAGEGQTGAQSSERAGRRRGQA